MAYRTTWSGLLIILVWLSISHETIATRGGGGSQKSDLVESLIELLYGANQWKLDNYCSEERERAGQTTDREISDSQIESLYNGTYLQNASNTSNWSAALKLIDEANSLGASSRQDLALVCSISSWGYADPLVEDLANRPHENKPQCLAQLEEFYSFVRKLQNDDVICDTTTTTTTAQKYQSHNGIKTNFTLHHWLQFNSFGRFSSALPYRNNLLLGDYDTCTQTLDSTRYCLGAYDKPSRKATNGQAKFSFRLGMCLPKSCSARILLGQSGSNQEYMQLLDYIVKSSLPNLNRKDLNGYQLVDLHCPPHEVSLLLASGSVSNDLIVSKILLIYLPLAWLSMLATATLIYPWLECEKSGEFYQNYVRPFDLQRNWCSFWESRERTVKLAGLNGAKVLSMIWLFLAHISMTIHAYVDDTSKLQPYTIFGALTLQGQHGVQVFFIISGLLVGLKYLRRDTQIDWLQMIVTRYLRLMPMYLIVYAYVKLFLPLTGDGPLWDYGVSVQSEARQCSQESWLVPILMLANFTPPFAHCIITGWHIANDFHIYLMMPLLLWAYKRSRRFGTWIVLAVFCLTHGTHFYNWGRSANYTFSSFYIQPFVFGPRVVLDRLSLDYVNPLGRLGTYFLGVLVADRLLLQGEKLGRPSAGQFELGHQREPKCLLVSSRAMDANNTREQQYSRRPPTLQAPTIKQQSYNGTAVNSPSSSSTMQATSDDACCIMKWRWSWASIIKENLTICAAVFLAFGPLCAPLLPAHIKQLLPYAKAINYPLMRVSVDLGWSLLIYYMLRDNFKCAAVAQRTKRTNASSSSSTSNYTTDSQTIIIDNFGQLNFGGFILKKPAWNVLVKLNYTLMLVHYPLIRYLVQSQRQLITFTWTNYFQLTTFLLLVAYALSLLLHLAVEIPLTALVRLLITKRLFATQQLATSTTTTTNNQQRRD